ncbi:MAG: hypothetical protein ISR68_00225 [Campylobacterales bacterium]|nr:hypothetical protein [Campylobacterales bacterium]
MKYIIALFIALFAFTGCSSKKHFEPSNVIDEINLSIKDMSNTIKSFKLDSGVTLKDGSVITKDGKLDQRLPNGFNLLNYNENKIIAVNNNTILVGSEQITLSNEAVSATLQNNILAIVFIDNSIAMYDMQSKKIIFKDYYDHSFLNDIKIANPYFMDDVILFPTLDGKVIVVDTKNKKVIRSIVVSTSGDIKNIIYMGVVNDTFIAATSNKILSLGDGTVKTKDFDISSIVASKNNIYISTIDGYVKKLDISLNELGSKKYKFAKIFAMVHTDGYIYALESEGYILAIDDTFTKDSVYKFKFNNKDYAVAIDNTIFFNDKYIEIK